MIGMSKRVVQLGHPVTYSITAALQQAAFEAVGMEVTYEAVDTPVIDLPGAVQALRGEEYLGAAISFPHKERVVPMVDRITEEAQHTGAVDTVTRDGRQLIGHNTDVLGFRPALDALVGRQRMPRSAVVLGAGGAARAVVYALITTSFQHIVVFNRHLHRAERLVKHFSRSAAHMELRAKPWHESVIEAELSKAEILINASSVGLDPNESPLAPELLPPDIMVLDLRYVPRESKLLRDAQAAGASVVMNGDVMLIHRTAAAFELWTGDQAPLDVMRERLEAVRDLPEAPVTASGQEVAS
jgi:shikimate dehydrogenase